MKQFKDNDKHKNIMLKMQAIYEEHKKTMHMMNEMAMPLKVYIRKIENYMYELIQNWCLCKWCQLYDPMNINFNHWKKELRNCINQLKDPILKSNANKEKHLRQQLVEFYELNDKHMVYRMICDKFDDEHIFDKKQIDNVAKAFADNIEQLICLMSNVDSSTKEYVQATFAV